MKNNNNDVVAGSAGFTISWKWLITIIITIVISVGGKVGSFLYEKYSFMSTNIINLQKTNYKLKADIARIEKDASDSELKLLNLMMSSSTSVKTFFSDTLSGKKPLTSPIVSYANIEDLVKAAKIKNARTTKHYEQTQITFDSFK